jgi:predicted amidophosphoribosyltransferase
MITKDQITPRLAVSSLASELCPACGGKKKFRQTFCARCYFSLPKAMQRATYARLGSGYQEAIVDALNYLQIETPHWPAESGGGE